MPHAGQIIKTRRDELNLTQEQLAQRLGVTQPAVTYMEARGSINSSRIPDVAGALEMTPERFALLLVGSEEAA